VQYAAHLQHNPSDPLSSAHTTLCSMILDELLITESALNFFLSIRTLLRKDCSEILHWLKDPSEPVRPIFSFPLVVEGGLILSFQATPMVISSYLDTLCNLYAPLANGLDIFVAGLPESVRAR